MWIVTGVAISLCVLLLRFLTYAFPWRPRPHGQIAGIDYFEKLKRVKGGTITGFSAGLVLRSPVIFRLHAETRADRFFKRLGLATEVQAGDAEFDRRIYVAGDHGFLALLLKNNAAVRRAVLDVLDHAPEQRMVRDFLLGRSGPRVRCDGQVLWLDLAFSGAPTAEHKRLLEQLRRAFIVLESELPRRHRDPFLLRAFVVEALVWSVFVYAAIAGVAAMARSLTGPPLMILDDDAYLAGSIAAGLLLAAGFVALVVLWLRGSSRGHLVILESALALVIALPVAALQVVSDLNRGLDRSAPATVSKTIVAKESRSRNKRVDYWLQLDRTKTRPKIPRRFYVEPGIYAQAAPGRIAEFEVRQGALGLAWCSGMRIVDAAGGALAAPPMLAPGAGSFVFSDPDGDLGKPLTVWYYNPGLEPATPVVFVMHGQKRNGEKYRDAWAKHARDRGFLLLVAEFSKDSYPDSEQYNLGNMFSDSGQPLDESRWTFTAIERVFDQVKTGNGLTAERYGIYGHSAGAQFVHRLVLFKPDARIHTAIAANAGWYAMTDFDVEFPYGLGSSGADEAMLGRALGRKLILLLGAEDTDEDHDRLRKTPEAMRQGANRFDRGNRFFATARARAAASRVPFNWELQEVAGVGHSNSGMAPAAAALLSGKIIPD